MLSNICRLMCVFLFALLACSPGARSQQAGGTRGSVYADSCIAPTELQLDGIALHADDGAVGQLGKWLRVTTDSGEDDGGRYERRVYFYRDLEIEVVRGLVTRVTTRSPSTSTPSGLRPGLSREAVRNLLLNKGVTFKQPGDTLVIIPCSPEGLQLDDVMEVAFDRSGRVQAILVYANRP
jgi:hypothetical protein